MTYILKACLDDYAIEYGKPEKIDLVRYGFACARLLGFFGAERDVETLKRKDSRDYRAARIAMGVTDSTIRRELGVLARALDYAAEEERIEHVPVLVLPREGPSRERWFSPEEVGRIMSQPMSESTRLWLLLALGTGARKSAITTVPWDRVDLERGFIDYRDPSRKVTKKRRARVAIPDMLVPVLREARAKATGPLVIGRDVGREVKKVLRGAGIDERGVNCHAFKRTMVTLALIGGAKAAEVSAATATSMVTLEKHYINLLPEHTRGAVNAAQIKG